MYNVVPQTTKKPYFRNSRNCPLSEPDSPPIDYKNVRLLQKYISEITKYITLMPGDVIWMGTDGSSPNMKSGDICEVEISSIGVLSNPIVKSDISN